MRKIFILAAVGFQILVLVYMAGTREYIFRNGRSVYLRTAPVDPRDLFRGDYVRLNYDISQISVRDFRGNLKEHMHDRGRVVYTVLKQGPDGVAGIAYVTDEKPGEEMFIKGRIGRDWRFTSTDRGIEVKYGIEAYFVQQGRGLEIEKKQGNRNEIQTPLEMEAALGSSGTAVLKNHRWSPIGIGLEVTRQPERNDQERNEMKGPRSVKIRITLMNASDLTLAIVNLPDLRSFSLKPAVWSQKDWELAQPLSPLPPPEDRDVIILEPQGTAVFDFDFSDTRWHVTDGKQQTEIGTLAWTEMFRLVYAPPSPEACQGLKDKDIIWHGELPSRAFHGQGNVD